MYGLVNRGIEHLVRHQHGDATWERVLRRAGIEHEVFVTGESYPDSLTYTLLRAASEELRVSTTDFLRAFGRHWILFTGSESYGALFDLTGATLPEFLTNMDRLHAATELSAPSICPPHFRCTEVRDGSLRLHYHSRRAGLWPMVEGILQGLGERFGVRVHSELVASRERGADHEEFLITYSAV